MKQLSAPGPVRVVVAVLLLVGCSPSASPAPSPTDTGPSASAVVASEPAVASEQAAATCPSEYTSSLPLTGTATVERAQITNVQAIYTGDFERIAFTFAEGSPDFMIESASSPFVADPSGLPLQVDGNGFLKITLTGGSKVAPDGTLTSAGPTEFYDLGYFEIVSLIEGGDFEAVSTWYAGLTEDECLYVHLLPDPSRLVIDIPH